MNAMNLNDKIVIVTGSGKGLGRDIALSVANHGGIPVIVDLDEAGAKETLATVRETCPRATMRVADLTGGAAVKEVIGAVAREYGRLDVLVNNAGILDSSTIEELEEESWDKVIDCNLKSAFLCSKYACEVMKAQGSGKILNVTSVAGRMGGVSVGPAYAASKAGMIGMTKNFARKCARLGITVNAIAPGTLDSGMSNDFTPEQTEKLYASIPLGRFAKPWEISNLAIFLISDACGYVTGSVYDANGGLHME